MSASSRLNSIRALDCPPAKAVGPAGDARDNSIVRTREALRAAIDESGWKHEAIAAAMSDASGLTIDAPYLSKLLSGEKPIAAKHIEALPDEVEQLYSKHYAESFGHVVVPRLSEEEARRHLAIGLFGMLARRA